MNQLTNQISGISDLNSKYHYLQATIKSYQSVVIGFSGGVDSSLLAKVAYDILGVQSLVVIGISPSYPRREKEEAVKTANIIGIPFITVETEEMTIEEYRLNKGNRCYYCKNELYTKLLEIKKKYHFSEVLDGTNLSDLEDIRPGLKATEELGIKKPLIEAYLTKKDIRDLSHQLGLPNWDKPSFACLSSRFPNGTEITIDSLSLVEQGEQLLYELGFRQFRLRYHQEIARIELLESDFHKILDNSIRKTITEKLSQLGFQHIALDLIGYHKENTSLKNELSISTS